MEALSQTFFFLHVFFFYVKKKKQSGSVNRLVWQGDTGSGLCAEQTHRGSLWPRQKPHSDPHVARKDAFVCCWGNDLLISTVKKLRHIYPTTIETIDSFGSDEGRWENQHASSLTHLENSHTSSLTPHLWEGSVILCSSYHRLCIRFQNPTFQRCGLAVLVLVGGSGEQRKKRQKGPHFRGTAVCP